MISFQEATLKKLAIHRVGNKLQNEHIILSDAPIDFADETLSALLKTYFLSAFERVHDVYRFTHSTGQLQLNEVNHFVNQYFDQENDFHSMTKDLAKFLHESSNHPKIKAGELYVAEFERIQFEGEELEAIGLFKSENKETYLKVFPSSGGFQMDYDAEGININKLDKGCLILRADREEGYRVLALDQTNRQQEAVYWKDDFLQLRIRQDNYQRTEQLLSVCKQFISGGLDEAYEMEKADKIDLMNRSIAYFKEKDAYKEDEFVEEVIGNQDAARMFREYKTNYEQEQEISFTDDFQISSDAVKKQSRQFKSVLKLDKNFHVYIHGKRSLIEKGFDEERSMNYYKLFYEREE